MTRLRRQIGAVLSTTETHFVAETKALGALDWVPTRMGMMTFGETLKTSISEPRQRSKPGNGSGPREGLCRWRTGAFSDDVPISQHFPMSCWRAAHGISGCHLPANASKPVPQPGHTGMATGTVHDRPAAMGGFVYGAGGNWSGASGAVGTTYITHREATARALGAPSCTATDTTALPRPNGSQPS